MAKKILRYSIEITDEPHQLHYPQGSRIVHVGSKNNGFVDIWVECAADVTETELHTFQVYTTGHVVPDDAVYVGTAMQTKIGFSNLLTEACHLYERMA